MINLHSLASTAALLVGLGMASALQGADPVPLRFRRVLVPQDELESQIRGLLPMKRDEFDRRLQQATIARPRTNATAQARIERAAYSARFEGEALVAGHAALTIAAAGDGPTWLRLGPCNLALDDPRWGDGGAAAIVGQSPQGELAGLVLQSGELQLDWSLRGKPLTGGAVQFQLQLPPALSSAITLELPAERTLAVTGGLVVGGEPAPGNAGRKLWRVDVGGHGRVSLTVQSTAAIQSEVAIIGVRENSTYSLYGSALDLQTTFDLDLLEQQPEPLKLRIEQPLELTTIRRGEESLSWRTLARDESALTVAVDDLGPMNGGNVALEVTATGPWSPDPPATLPRLTIVDGVYQEGLANLVAPGWLRMQARPLRGCWQSSVIPAAPGRSVDQLQFHLQEPGAAMEVATDSHQPRLYELSGTQITIDPTYISAVATTEVTALGGERYQIEAQIPRRWLIDAVDVSPADDVSDRSLTPGDGATQFLRLNLRAPLSATRPLRITIRARQRRPAGAQSLAAAFFRVANFSQVREAKRLVAIRTVDPNFRLQLSVGEGVLRLDPGTLPEPQMRLFETLPGSVMFDDSENSAAVIATLSRTPVRYRAEIQMETRVEARTLQEAVSLRCLPDGSAIGQVLVRLSPRPPGSITWLMVGEDRRAIEVEPVALETEDADGAYRVRLAQPRSEPFELRGEWSRTLGSSAELVLASAPEATSQSGVMEVHALDAKPFDFVPDEMRPQLIPSSTAEQWTTLRGRYVYEPGRQAHPRLAPIPSKLAPAAATITSLTVDSRFDGRGNGEHEVALEIENHGLRQLQLRLPLTARDARILYGRTGKMSPVVRLSPALIAIDLPVGERRTTARLRYRSEDTALGWKPIGRLTAPLVSADLPVLTRRWNISIAPGLAFVSGEHSSEAGPLASRLWRQDSALRGSTITAVSLQPGTANSVDRAFQGWAQATALLSADDEAAIDVYQPDVMRGLALAALLGATGLAFWLRRSSGWLLAAALLTLSLGLLQGPALAPLMNGVAAGLLLGGATRLFWPAARQPVGFAVDASSRLRPRGLTAGLCVACGAIAAACAATALAQPAPPPATDERVVIPIDAEQQPTGDYVYLSPQLYERLQALSDDGRPSLPAWLITEAHYDLPGATRVGAAAPTIDEIQAHFEVEALQASTIFELPVRRDQVVLLEGRARLDGTPAQVTWRDDGAALLLPLDTPGPHRVELAFGAIARKDNDGVLLELNVPAISRCTVGTQGMTGPPPSILSAQGDSVDEGPAVEPRTALGPAEKLTALWPPAGDKDAAVRLEAEQLQWWTLRPGSVVVEGKFKFRPIGGAIQRVSIAIDPRLRLLPGAIRPAPARSWVDEGSPAVLHLELAESTSTEVSIYGSWLWIGASGTGNLLLPPIQARADRLVRSWCGISAEQSLAVTAQPPALKGLQPEDFLIAWNEPAAEPAIAIDELASGGRLQVTAQPAASQPTVEHVSVWSLRQGRAVLQYTARQAQIPSNRYQQRLELPPALKVSRVEILAQGKAVPLRWDQRADGTLVLMHLAPPPAAQVLQVDAEVRLGERDRWTLPQPQLQDAIVASRLCRIYRQRDLLVNVPQAEGWIAEEASFVGGRSEGLGRLVADLRTDGPVSKPLSVELAANKPAIEGTMAMLVAEDDGAWSAAVDLALRINSGVVDAVRLEVPAEWSGPFEISPAVEHRIRAVPGSTAQELTIWPQQAAAESLHLSIRAPLRPADGQAVRAPAVQLPQAQSLDRFVLLDARFGGDRLRWETKGLQAISAAAGVPAAWLASDVETFRATADRYEALPLALPRFNLKPQITYVETSVTIRPDERLLQQTTFYIDPESAPSFDVSLPPGSRLASLTVDGQVAICRASGLRSWRVASPAAGVPLQLRVVYDSPITAEADDGLLHLQQAQIQKLTPRRTVWRLSGLSPAALTKGQQAATGIDAEIARLEAAASALADLAGAPPGDLPTASLGAAWQYWQPQWSSVKERLQAHDWEGEAGAQQKLRRDAANQKVDELTKKLVQSGVLPRETLAIESGRAPTLLLPEERSEAIVLGQGSAESQQSILVKRAQPRVTANPHWIYAAIAACAALLVVLLERLAFCQKIWAVQPSFVLVLAGLAWWLLAPWPWLGWIAVAAGVWLSLYPPWVRRSSENSHFGTLRPAAR